MTVAAGTAGTYHYWATTTRSPLARRYGAETQLSGAFVIDEPGAAADKVFVMTYWSLKPPGPLGLAPPLVYVINGLAWAVSSGAMCPTMWQWNRDRALIAEDTSLTTRPVWAGQVDHSPLSGVAGSGCGCYGP